MTQRLAPGMRYKGRPPGIRPVSLSLDEDSAQLLETLAPTRKAHGRLISELIRSHALKVRLQERLTALAEEIERMV